ncbi:PilZ domain-containing protein [Marinobacter sp.]|uniref:PilZ domain-containing protein n=1 Tax=Marinobacter sp. TaxID=50741 RepID=UPI0034A1DAE5
MADDRRTHNRTAMSAKVRVSHPTQGEFVFVTRDISDGGIFIVVESDPFEPAIGDEVEVQVQGLPVSAPVLSMEVVRQTVDGFGLQFADQ